MGIMTDLFDTLRVRWDADICFIQMHRPDADNAISHRLIEELSDALRACEDEAKVVVLEGLPEVFCTGADFKEIRASVEGASGDGQHNPELLYDVWRLLASGSFISVAHVRGRVSAGGMGFVAACDIVVSEERATFSLPELLFGLMPACVMPFLVRRIGFARANFLSLATQPIPARQALDWGLVDACEDNSENLLRKQLLRLRRLGRDSVARYKRYASGLDDSLVAAQPAAVAANTQVFSDPENLRRIARFVQTGEFPWEAA